MCDCLCVCACVCACARVYACVSSCVRAFVRAIVCMRVCTRNILMCLEREDNMVLDAVTENCGVHCALGPIYTFRTTHAV